MFGLILLLSAIALLIWVLAPLARWQLENDLCECDEGRNFGEDPIQSDPLQHHDPLASHPYARRTKPLRRTTVAESRRH